jgi:hypothetical protein
MNAGSAEGKTRSWKKRVHTLSAIEFEYARKETISFSPSPSATILSGTTSLHDIYVTFTDNASGLLIPLISTISN